MAYSKDSQTSAVPVRKKLKTSDLPLASATRAAIEGLAHTFKKKGGYDSLRKQLWGDLEKSVGVFPSVCPSASCLKLWILIGCLRRTSRRRLRSRY